MTSTPEYFQRKWVQFVDGMLCLIYNILIFGRDRAEHDERLFATLNKIQNAGVMLNAEKYKFWCDQIKFLGHVISKNGVTPDPAKTAAIKEMEAPTNSNELCRFVGTVNQLEKFSPHLAETFPASSQKLLSTKQAWLWDTRQEEPFTNIKTELTNPTILALYNPTNRNEDICRCLFTWAGSHFIATRRIMATGCLCLESINQHKISICTNQEEGPGHLMGMRKVL